MLGLKSGIRLLGVTLLSLTTTAALAREAGAPTSVPAGNTIGVAVAASPPPGFYFSSRSGYWDAELSDGNGDFGGQENTLVDTAFQFIWVPGTKILGGDYKAFATIPLLYNDQTRSAPFPAPMQGSESKLAFGNVEIHPLEVSWMIQPGIFVSTGFSIFAPTGQFSDTAEINSGANFWTFSPSIGYSYLRDGWNASVHAQYFTNTENKDTDYRSGDDVLVNATVMKDLGGWSMGPVAYYRKQVTSDTNNGTSYGGTIQGKAEQTGVGLSVSKRFGAVEANVSYTHDVHVRNTVGGDKFWVNFTMPIGKK